MVKVVLDEGAKMPTRAHVETDAGLDLYTKETKIIWPHDSATFDTGVHMAFEPGTYGKIESKSGLNVKHGIVACGGVVDVGYTGSIVVKLYNLSDDQYTFNAGDKIAQLIIQRYENPELVQVDKLEETERGSGGFGSTGR